MKLKFLLLPFLLSTLTVKAQIIHIPSDQLTIQAGITDASDGDTILVEEGTYYENINFLGKAITVASRFILDGDTSHISKTIINGSQSTKVDTGSVVLMMSLEDTTSVLAGFTITGGTGSHLEAYWKPDLSVSDFLGGGIAIVNAGGKIVHNIIEHNRADATGRDDLAVGGGLYANVSYNRTAIIRDNIIRNNVVTSDNRQATGAGALFLGGRLLVEANQFTENTSMRSGGGNASGGGFYWGGYGTPGVIREVIFRDNIISHNKCLGEGTLTGGGGAIICFENGDNPVEFYNNIIAFNYSSSKGGGLSLMMSNMNIVNNTIYGNLAASGAHNIVIEEGGYRIINNIIWSDPENGTGKDLEITGNSSLEAHHNLLRMPVDPAANVKTSNNIFTNPLLDTISFALFSDSRCVGRAVDSLVIGNILYTSPVTDLNGNTRPNPIDNRVDIGAIESPFEGLVDIPDTAFLYALIEDGVDTNEDGLISYGEAEAVKSIEATYRDIHSIAGIEAFINLEELVLFYNQIESLDISNNTGLTELDVNGNSLDHIDVSMCPSLIGLYCQNNSLTSLNVRNNKKLEILECHSNMIETLDISENQALKFLWCSNMPSLGEVCVWDSFVEEAECPEDPCYGADTVCINVSSSPNVCFETDCNGYCDEETGFDSFNNTGIVTYPNPTNTFLTIETEISDRYHVEITALNGHQLLSTAFQGFTTLINLSPFQKGIYFITIRSKDYVTTRKIIKL